MYLALSATYSVFYGSARFRYLIEFSFIIFTAYAVVTIAAALIPSLKNDRTA